MAVEKVNEAEQFKSSLEDVLTVIKALDGTCETLAELAGMIELALDNQGQARLLYEKVRPQRR